MTVSADIYAGVRARDAVVDAPWRRLIEADTGSKVISFQDGTTDGKADRLWSDVRTLAASASENLDLAGSLTDPGGATVTFVKVKAIFVRATATNVNDVVLGNAAANAFVGPFGAAAHTLAVKPGGTLLLVAPNTGWTVTAGTGDQVKVLNGGAGTAVEYEIIILGTSA